MSAPRDSKKKGFTLVELLVSVGIFVVMTTVLVVKYGNFDDSVLMTNLAYDVALVMRQAQTFGMSVTSSDSSGTFQYAYGVNFTTGSSASTNKKDPSSNRVIMFADSQPNGTYDYDTNPDTHISTYTITRGVSVSKICGTNGASEDCTLTSVSITFKRPDPDAIIKSGSNQYSSVKITLSGYEADQVRAIEVNSTGQITVIQ